MDNQLIEIAKKVGYFEALNDIYDETLHDTSKDTFTHKEIWSALEKLRNSK